MRGYPTNSLGPISEEGIPLGGEAMFVVERIPAYENSGYTRQVVWIDQAEYRTMRVEYYDRPSVRSIVRAAEPGDYRWSSLILGIVESTPFQMRKAREP